MKNKIIIPVILMIVLTISLGCGISESVEKAVSGTGETNSNGAGNKTLTDTAIDTAVGNEKIGVQECDDLLEDLAAIVQKPDDNYVSKATRQYVLSKIRENIKKSIEQNKNDKTQMAKECKEYRGQLDKFKNQEEANKQ
jgi:soluble cytochrome b562